MKKALFVLLCAITFGARSIAFEVDPVDELGPTSIPRWASSDLPVAYVLDSKGSEDVSFAETSSEVEDAFSAWQNIGKQFWKFTFAGSNTPAVLDATDGVNSVLWIEKDWPQSSFILAITRTSFVIQDPPNFLDVDIFFNGDNFQWSAKEEAGKVRILTVAQHEIGHFVGLKHSQVKGATMFPTGAGSSPLSKDEQAGIQFLYPESLIASFKILSPLKRSKILNSPGSTFVPLVTFRWTTPAGFTNFVVDFSPSKGFSPSDQVESFPAGNASFLQETESIRTKLARLAGTANRLFWRVRADSAQGSQTTKRSFFFFEE